MKEKTTILKGDVLHVRLREGTQPKLRKIAEKKGMTMSALARFWIEERVNKETK